MQIVAVMNQSKNSVLGEQVRVAETMLTRMVGLLGQSGLESGTGLLILPTQAIHTVAMRFAIDVIFLDRESRVVHLRPAMKPYRLSGLHWKAQSVLELPEGVIARTSTEIGDQLAIA